MDDHRRHDHEVERYRQAAQDALGQLDWCIGYLHGIRKTGIASALARNRQFIRHHLMHMPSEPVPAGSRVEDD